MTRDTPAPIGRARRAWPRWRGRLMAIGSTALAAVLGCLLPIGAVPAAAADTPNAVTILGAGLNAPLRLRSAQQPDLVRMLIRQVSWMAVRAGDPMKVDEATLGSRYALTVLTNDVAVQTYDVYPEAVGGPRAYRPASQPMGQTTAAWFYAAVALPDLLRLAGVPLTDPGTKAQANGLQYGDPAAYVPPARTTSRPTFDLAAAWRQEQLVLLASAAAALFVLILLFAAARLNHRFQH